MSWEILKIMKIAKKNLGKKTDARKTGRIADGV